MSLDIQSKKILLLVKIEQISNPSVAELSRETGIPESTIKRLISTIKKEFLLDIRFGSGRSNILSGAVIYDWGILNKDQILKTFGSTNSSQEIQKILLNDLVVTND